MNAQELQQILFHEILVSFYPKNAQTPEQHELAQNIEKVYQKKYNKNFHDTLRGHIPPLFVSSEPGMGEVGAYHAALQEVAQELDLNVVVNPSNPEYVAQTNDILYFPIDCQGRGILGNFKSNSDIDNVSKNQGTHKTQDFSRAAARVVLFEAVEKLPLHALEQVVDLLNNNALNAPKLPQYFGVLSSPQSWNKRYTQKSNSTNFFDIQAFEALKNIKSRCTPIELDTKTIANKIQASRYNATPLDTPVSQKNNI